MAKNSLIGLLMVFFVLSSTVNANLITYDPNPKLLSLGEQFELDIIFNGEISAIPDPIYGSALFEYYIRFAYDPSVISIDGVIFGYWALNDWGLLGPPGSQQFSISSYGSGGLNQLELKIKGFIMPIPTKTFLDEIFATIEITGIGNGETMFYNVGGGASGSWGELTYAFSDTPQTRGLIRVSGSSPVPEPSAIFLIGLGLVGLAGVARDRCKKIGRL